ncbi:MAG: YigZ family protein [Candidatus Cloacimonas sp.]
MLWTIENKTQSEIKIKRSRFVCTLYPLPHAENVKDLLNEHCRLYATANHHCYAYIYGLNKDITYYSDAGEPSGTAGKPILNALLRNNLTNILAIVTRYFGGIKLGVKGLIDAYGESVEQTIMQSKLIEAKQLVYLSLTCDYPTFETLKHIVETLAGEISQVIWTEEVSFVASMPAEQEQTFMENINCLSGKYRLNY